MLTPEQQILDLFRHASFHFADDTGSEWDRAYWRLDRAAEIIVEQQYPLYRIKEIVRTSDSLIDIDTILTRVLKVAYKST
jgi:hypothetical protein